MKGSNRKSIWPRAPLPSEPSLGDSEPDLGDSFEPAGREHDFDHSADESTPDAAFDLDAETMSFDLGGGATAEEDSPRIDADQTAEDADLVGFGDEPDDVPSLDMPADDDAELVPVVAEQGDDEKEPAGASARASAASPRFWPV